MKTCRHRVVVSKSRSPLVVGFLFLGAACAQVPRQSVELSTTVGRDLTELHRSHLATTNVLFQRMKDDVNEFVDTKYAPFQIQQTLEAEMADRRAGNFGLMQALENAAAEGATQEQTEMALGMMQIYVELLTAEIEGYRAKLLGPILEQEAQVTTDVNQSYERVLYANSIVTGHLASVAKVHDAQAHILQKVGLSDLRQSSGAALVKASDSIGDLLGKARKAEGTLDRFGEVAGQIKEAFKEDE